MKKVTVDDVEQQIYSKRREVRYDIEISQLSTYPINMMKVLHIVLSMIMNAKMS